MKTHPRVGGEALVRFSCTRAFALSRAIALTRPDFWDPAGLSSDGSVENFKRRRQTELKHGRISMLATMGYITPEITGKSAFMCQWPIRSVAMVQRAVVKAGCFS